MANEQSQQARRIGVFVLGGLMLLVFGIIIFGSFNFSSRTEKYVLYFQGSLKGLDIGSPVSFRGVKIGQVIDIVMEIDREKRKVYTPVYVEIDTNKFQMTGKEAEGIDFSGEKPFHTMIEKGLRAQLSNLSLITGQMYIELEFRPLAPSYVMEGVTSRYPVIPTILSPLDRVQATLDTVLESIQKLELQQLANTTAGTLETIHAASLEFYEVMRKVNQRIDPILANVDASSAEGKQVLKDASAALVALNKAAEDARKLFGRVDKQVEVVSPALNRSTENARVAFDEVGTAMRALRQLAEFLERNPDALLTGKQNRR